MNTGIFLGINSGINVAKDIANDKIKGVLEGKNSGESRSTKLDEFAQMYNKLLNINTKPTKLSAKEMLEKFDLENIENKETKLNDELISFFENEIEKQKNRKVDVITNEEFDKIFNGAVHNEKSLLEELKAIESLEEVMEDIQEVLNKNNNNEMKLISDKLNSFIYNSNNMDYKGADDERNEIVKSMEDLHKSVSFNVDMRKIEEIEDFVNKLKNKSLSLNNEQKIPLKMESNIDDGRLDVKKQIHP